jgi:hypothetical protein
MRPRAQPLLAIASLLAFSHTARADDAGAIDSGSADTRAADANAADDGTTDANAPGDAVTDAAIDTPTDVAAEGAGDDSAPSSTRPGAALAECPADDVSRPCSGGTCISATCFDESGQRSRACAVCVPLEATGGPYCPEGLSCGDGDVCRLAGGAGGQPAIGPDGSAETVAYSITECRSPAPVIYYGPSSSSKVGEGCDMQISPQRTHRPEAVAFGALLAATLVAWRRLRRGVGASLRT